MIDKIKAVLSIIFDIFIGILCLVAAIIIVGGDKIIHKFVRKMEYEKNKEEE